MLVYSSSETQKFASDLLNKLKKDQNVLALVGNLGSGKTTFTQGISCALGISQRVVSPTFVLMRSYNIGSDPKLGSDPYSVPRFKTLYHFDLYRLSNIQEIKELGIEEIWEDPNNLVVIEWAEKVREILPKNTVWLEFRYIDEETREITMS